MVLSAKGLDLSGERILDAFAGSGALGLELLSRGAHHALFIDRSPRAARVVARNVRDLGARARVVTGDAWGVLARGGGGGGPFGIVLLDPPYATPAERVADLVCALAAQGMLEDGAVIVHERAERAEGLDGARLAAYGIARARTRAISQSAIDLWRYDGAARQDPSAP